MSRVGLSLDASTSVVFPHHFPLILWVGLHFLLQDQLCWFRFKLANFSDLCTAK